LTVQVQVLIGNRRSSQSPLQSIYTQSGGRSNYIYTGRRRPVIRSPGRGKAATNGILLASIRGHLPRRYSGRNKELATGDVMKRRRQLSLHRIRTNEWGPVGTGSIGIHSAVQSVFA